MTYFHAARRSAREAILAEGLRATDPRVTLGRIVNPAAVYAFQDAKWCPWHAKHYRGDDFDVWAVNATGLPVQDDETHRALGGVAILVDVPADRLTFVEAL